MPPKNYTEKQTMRDCVKLLRAGWYGDASVDKKACNCAKLVSKAQSEANDLINSDTVGAGLSGTIKALIIAPEAEFVSSIAAEERVLVSDPPTALLPAEADGFAPDTPDDTDDDGADGETLIL